ncbi:hypothetical protein [Nocardia iowensis]|uniref:Uncharacterized protein n=1 Tax=Nocardia iowensis TaxID=204891 RepID=A0ABX8RS56_NOCIO|nr:hypothetical protein [Nocardia iowensis]QXN92485.1 hypothetical protein KV110_04865 [Nocardia iowensis]
MREDFPNDDELRSNFEELLASVRGGDGLFTESGLDTETENALLAIARAYPEVPDHLITAARRAFAGQLDGSNAAAVKAATARKIAEINRRGTTR